jgi:hypothetical protein
MVSTPRCGHPVEYYELRREPDKMDVVPRGPDRSRCWRPRGHPGRRHVSEAAYRRMLAQAVLRNRERRARRRGNVVPR